MAKTGSGKSIFGFNGQYGVLTDPNGLIFMRSRFYSPDLKRFMTPDILKGSIADSTSLNLYTFVNGDPINYVDPFGTDRSNTYKYDRYAAVNYAYDFYDESNPEYVKFDDVGFFIYYLFNFYTRSGTDCANFVSQCLVAGGIEENEEWHFDRYCNTIADSWMQAAFNQYSGRIVYYDKNGNLTYKPEEYDFTANWSMANSQFNYFSNPDNGYTSYDEPIIISDVDQIRIAIDLGVQIGDLIYFSKDGGETVHHAAIINYITYNNIFYAAHSVSAFDKSIRDLLDEETAIIVRLSDEQKKK